MMAVGFDVSQTGSGKAGCGFFAHALIEAMLEAADALDFSLYTSFGDFFLDPRMAVRSPWTGRHVSYGPRHLSREAAAEFWNAPDLEARLQAPAVVHSNNFWCPLQLKQARLVYTFYDLGFATNPDWTTESNRTGCFEGAFRAALAADLVVAISQFSRDHFLRVFPHFPAERMRVICPASRFAGARLDPRPPAAVPAEWAGRFWLSVGTIEPRKNQLRLAEAYAAYRQRVAAPLPLVFAGGRGWLMDDFEARLDRLGVREYTVVTGYVSDDELAWLFGNCHANLYPSLFEGFGMPVLEGMTFGAPTVAANTSSIPEAAGDAGLLLDPEDTAAWTEAMVRLQGDAGLRQGLAERARLHARRFSWQAGARDLLSAYGEVCAMPKRVPA